MHNLSKKNLDYRHKDLGLVMVNVFSVRYFCGTRQSRVPTINRSKHESTDNKQTNKHMLPNIISLLEIENMNE